MLPYKHKQLLAVTVTWLHGNIMKKNILVISGLLFMHFQVFSITVQQMQDMVEVNDIGNNQAKATIKNDTTGLIEFDYEIKSRFSLEGDHVRGDLLYPGKSKEITFDKSAGALYLYIDFYVSYRIGGEESFGMSYRAGQPISTGLHENFDCVVKQSITAGGELTVSCQKGHGLKRRVNSSQVWWQ